MPSTDQPRSSADIALEALALLRSQWDETAPPNQQVIAELLRALWEAVKPSPFGLQIKSPFLSSPWLAALEDFLQRLHNLATLHPSVQALARAPRASAEVSAEQQQALLAALQNFPAPGAPAWPAREFASPTSALLAALDDLQAGWSELPDEESRQIDLLQVELRRDLQQAGDAIAQQEAAISRFLAGIAGLSQAGALIQSRLQAKPYPKAIDYVVRRGPVFPPSPGQDYATPKGLAKGLVQDRQLAELLRFYSAIDFPAEIELRAEAAPLVVQLAVQPPDQSPLDAVRELLLSFSDPRQPEQVTVVVNGEGFQETTGDKSRTILVYSDRNSQPAVFLLRPQSAGRKRVVIDFYHKDRLVGSTEFETTVVEWGQRFERMQALASLQPGPVAGIPLSLPPQPPAAADLELRVISSADRRQLSFVLHSANPKVGYHWKSAGMTALTAEPQALLRSTFDRLSKMARSSPEQRAPDDDKAYRQELDGIGQILYEQLFSPELKQEYRARIRVLRQQGLIRSLLVTSDEPWIPWEIIKPYEYDEPSGQEIDDPFLCEQFRLSRWLAGRAVPPAISIQTAQLVKFADNLANVEQEARYFDGLPTRLRNKVAVRGAVETPGEILDLLAQAAAHLLHFACHGNFNYDDPNESVLRLKGGVFRPSQVAGKQAAGVRKSKPLVFVNACHAGRSGFSLTGIGGWAERFVDAGASAFVGGLWEVNDKLAADFAQTFYNELLGDGTPGSGKPLGEALYQARLAIQRRDPANPTWLAYTLYGDPNSKVELGLGR